MTARAIFVHPIHNFSVVQFDPSTVKGVFTAAVLSSRETEAGDCEHGSNSSSSSSSSSSNGNGNTSAAERAVATAAVVTAPVATVNEGDGTEVPENGFSTLAQADGATVQGNSPSSLSREDGTGAQANASGSPVAQGGPEDLSPSPLRPGDAAEFHGLTTTGAPVKQRTVVVKLERLLLQTSHSPQFTPHSVEVRKKRRVGDA